MDEKQKSVLESWEKLKSEIIACVDENGEIHGKEHDLPYRDRMSNFIRKVKGMGPLGPEFTCFLSSDSIYEKLKLENNVVRVKKQNPLTLDRLKEEVEEAKASGFTNGDKWRYDVKNYAFSHGMSFEDVMHELGYKDYKSPVKGRTIEGSIQELEEWSRNNGYNLDGVYGSEVEPALRFLYKRAGELDVDGAMYVMLMSDKLKVNSGRLYVDYMAILERRYNEYVRVHEFDIANLKKHDNTLYNMLLHMAEYAPGGSISVDEVRKLWGVTLTGKKTRRTRGEYPAERILEMSDDGVVSKLSEDKELHRDLIRMALMAGTTVQGLVSDGLIYKNGMSLPRLARVNIDYTDSLYDIKMDVKEAWYKEGVDGTTPASERERIALGLYDKELEKVVTRFCDYSMKR